MKNCHFVYILFILNSFSFLFSFKIKFKVYKNIIIVYLF